MTFRGAEAVRRKLESLMEIVLALDFLSFRMVAAVFTIHPSLRDPLASVKALAATAGASALLVLFLIYLLQLRRGETIASLGFGPPDRRRREVGIAVLMVPPIFLIAALVKAGFHRFAPGLYSGPRNVLEELMRGPGDLILLLLVGLFVGGLKEEIQRAFIIRRFEAGGGPAYLGALLYAGVFGYGHLVQGFDEAIIAGLFGLLWGILYLRRRSLVVPVVSHGLYDAVELIRYYFFGPLPGW